MSYINTKLENHFGSKVYVEPGLKAEAYGIYNLVKSEVRNYIPQYKNNAVTMVDMGSSSDGLKVVAPDEYDVMLVVENTRLKACESSDVPGYYTLQKPNYVREAANFEYRWISLDKCMVGKLLKPDKVRQSFESMMHKVENGQSDSKYKLDMRKSGPAIEVGVSWSGRSMTIDFVPAVKIRGDYFVARPLPYQDFNDVENREYLWRKSYVQEEKKEVSGFDKNLRKAVMLWKTARLYSKQLNMLSSYHFKTIGMMLASTTRGYSLEDCVIAVGEELIAGLKRKNLPCFFDLGVNLFYRKKSDSLDNLKNYLARNMKGGKLLKLLGVRESHGWCTSCCYCFCMFTMTVIAVFMILFMYVYMS